MTGPTLQHRIKDLLCREIILGITTGEVDDNASLVDDLALDSIQMIGLITALENEFEIELEDEDLDLQHFSTINSLAEFVQQKLDVNSSA